MIKRLPWLRKLKKTDPEVPVQLPINCEAMSNGEGWWPDSARKRLIRKLVLDKADEVSRKEGIDRREFLASSCGMATSLYMINLVNGCSSGKDEVPNMNLGGSGGNGGAGAMDGGSGSGAMGGSSGNSSAGSSGSGTGGSSGNGGGGTGGFNMPADAMTDADIADLCMGNNGNELIIDMQSHFANTETNALGAQLLLGFLANINNDRFPWIQRTMSCETMAMGTACYNRNEYVNQILLGSDTTIGVLSGISYAVGAGGMGGFAVLTNEDLIDGVTKLEMDYPGRMLSHAMVMPNDRLDVQLAMMERLANQYTNWKTYPPWNTAGNSTGVGYWLDSPEGLEMIQKGIDLGSPIFCVHKGFPLNSFSATYSDPKDVGPAAVLKPDAHLVIYHSAFENGLAAGGSTSPDPANPDADNGWGPGTGMWPEGPYNEDLENDPAAASASTVGTYPLNRGVNSLVWSLRKAGIGPNGTVRDGFDIPNTNVYAECGGVWPALMLQRESEGMHYWGKLLKYIGEDRIVWGTDCLWFGSPQPVIQAFRAFEISVEFQNMYGYPALTPAIKQKILGQNAARLQNVRQDVTNRVIMGCHSDYVSAANLKLKRELDQEWGIRRDMQFALNGPKTRREFMALNRSEHQEKLNLSGRIPNRIRI